MKKTTFLLSLLFMLIISSNLAFCQEEEVADSLQIDNEIVVLSQDTMRTDSVKEEAIVVNYYQAVIESSEKDKKIDMEEKSEKKKKSNRRNDIRTIAGSASHGGGYGALGIKMSTFKEQSLAMAGLRGAWVINRSLGFGLDLWGVIPTNEYDHVMTPQATEVNLLGGYGGILLEPIVLSNQVIHFTFPVSAGAGWLGYVPNIYENDDSDSMIDDDVFWYVEPGVSLELNLARNFRLNFGVSKRFLQGFELVDTGADDLGNLNYVVSMKIGRF